MMLRGCLLRRAGVAVRASGFDAEDDVFRLGIQYSFDMSATHHGNKSSKFDDFSTSSHYISVCMTTVIDRTNQPRHPEKVQRPDTPIQRKPDWIRVRAPVSREYAATASIVRDHNLH